MMKKLNLPDELIDRIIEAIEADENVDTIDVETDSTDTVTIPRDEYDTLVESDIIVRMLCALIEHGKGYAVDTVLEAYYDVKAPQLETKVDNAKEGE